MAFWGVEVKSGKPCSVEAEEGMILHLSQACLGEVKKDKGNEPVYIYLTIGGKKLVLGTLSSEKFPQLQFDLLFQNKFELSHSWKNGSVHFNGYICHNPAEESEDSEDESEEDLPVSFVNNGKPESQAMHEKIPATQNASAAKPDSAAAKKNVKIVEPKKGEKNVDSDGSSEDDYDDSEDEDSDSEIAEGETENEEEEIPNKVELSKKRPAVAATEACGPDKKAKFITPQKTGSSKDDPYVGAETKKGSGHVDTPYPSKQAGKTPANQSKQQTPKPAGSHLCKSCSRSFNSENALDSHTKAKHTPGK